MHNYKIEGNKNFYDELFKSLDADSDDESKLCLISGFPLEQNSVNLECNHKFNYEPLYKEICRQKFEFKTYDPHTLSKQDQIKIKNSGLDYFIKCPYCRNIQFTILPYHEELKLKPRYGVNSLDSSLPDKPINNQYQTGSYYGSDDFTYWAYGKLFKKGECSFINETTNTWCNHKYVTAIPNTDKSCCKYHYKVVIKSIKMEAKQKILNEKIKQKEEKQKLLDEKNAERLAKGLAPLKRLPVVKKNVAQNVVQQAQQIGQYVPEGETFAVGCKAILKTGPNKGSPCGCAKIYADGLCKRHSPNNKETKDDVKNDVKNDL